MANGHVENLAAAIDRLTLQDGAHDTAIPALRMYRTSQPTDYMEVIYEASLCIVAQGSKEVLLGEESFRYDPAQSLLVSVDLPVSGRVVEASPRKPCLMLRITLNMATVGELLAEGSTTPSPDTSSRGMGVIPGDPALMDAVARLVLLLESPADIGALSPLILREITYRILTGPQGTRLRQIASSGAPANRIAQALRLLKDRFADPLRIEDLTEHVAMSASAFHQHFKGLTGMSPLQYQKRLRLQEARRLMLGDGLEASTAAFRVGYESPSQFSREYRRMFGAPPQRDVSKVKLKAGA